VRTFSVRVASTQAISSSSSGRQRRRRQRRAPGEHLAGRAVDGQHVAALEDLIGRPALAEHGGWPRAASTRSAGGAGDARLAHAARDDRGVRGHAAAGREDADRGLHADDVLGRGLGAAPEHVLALGGGGVGGSAVNTSVPIAAPGDAGRPLVSATGRCAGSICRVEQLVELARLDAPDRGGAIDQALVT
jgi:hypothetical protein